MRIVGKPFKDLTLEKAVKLGVAIGSMAGGRGLVVSGRDHSRISRMLKRAITAGVMSTGADVMDFHESLTGEISFAMKRFGARMGFMVTTDPVHGGVSIRLYRSPGYEILGRELEEVLSRLEGGVLQPQEVGWIYYAEYMHELYVAAVSSFVKGDLISSRRLSVVVGPDIEPLSTVLKGLSRALSVNHVTIGGLMPVSKYPDLVLMEKLSKVSEALRTTCGVLLSHEGSSMVLYSSNLGFTMPEELLLIVLEKYSPGAKVALLNPVSEPLVKVTRERGFDVIVVDDELEFQRTVRRERPAVAFTWRGDSVTPVFSLGYDSIIMYAQVLEIVSEHSEVFEKVLSARRQLSTELVSVEEAARVCSEKSLDVAMWGCRVQENGNLVTYVYQPTLGGFLKVVTRVAESTEE